MNWVNAANLEVRLTITCGIDWAENHHDVALVDESGKLVAKRRIGDDAEGYRRHDGLLADPQRPAASGEIRCGPSRRLPVPAGGRAPVAVARHH